MSASAAQSTGLNSLPVVVVGASVAGVRTVQALRRIDAQTPVLLVGAEDEQPYDRPPLSKDYLYAGAEQRPLIDPTDLTATGIEFRRGVRAESLDVAAGVVRLSDKDHVRYRALVIATGARPRPLPWPDLEAAHVLRDLHSARRLQAALSNSRRVAVLGGGFIGSEVAAAAHRLGREVAVIDVAPLPLARIVGPTVGRTLSRVHAAHGVDTRFGTAVLSARATSDNVQLTLADGSVVDADLLVAGIGVTPDTAWLGTSGLDVTDGVLCDEYGRAVGAPSVYAVGDVARWHHPGHGRAIRVEHWTNAVEQATSVARTIALSPEPFTPSFYVWSDQYDWKIQMAGLPRPDIEPIVLGDTGGDTPRFVALYPGSAGQLAFSVTVNSAWAGLACRRAIDTEDAATVADRIGDRFARS